jgi:hypothetical protein
LCIAPIFIGWRVELEASMIDSSKGLIINHWRGNYPLGQAFWAHSVMIPGCVVMLLAWSLLNLNNADRSFVYMPFIWYAILMILSIWSLRGTCVSAYYHVARGGTATWRNVAFVALVGSVAILVGVSVVMSNVMVVIGMGSVNWT